MIHVVNMKQLNEQVLLKSIHQVYSLFLQYQYTSQNKDSRQIKILNEHESPIECIISEANQRSKLSSRYMALKQKTKDWISKQIIKNDPDTIKATIIKIKSKIEVIDELCTVNLKKINEQQIRLDQFKKTKQKQKVDFIHKQRLSKRYNNLVKDYELENKIIYNIFIETAVENIINIFNQLFLSIQSNSKYIHVQLLLIYFSYQHYEHLKIIFSSQSLKNHQVFRRNIQIFGEMINNPKDNPLNFSLFRAIMQIFKIRLLCNYKFTSIFQNMVIVDKQSPLLNKSQLEKNYCYYINQTRTCYIMVLNYISKCLYYRLKINVTMSQHDIRLLFLSSADNYAKFKYTWTYERPLSKIHKKKCQLISYVSFYSFKMPTMGIFIYNQLKQYYELLQIIRQNHADFDIESYVRKKFIALNCQKQDWNMRFHRMQANN